MSEIRNTLIEQMAVAYATEIEKLQVEIDRLRVLLKEARQYVSDAGCSALLADIDHILKDKP